MSPAKLTALTEYCLKIPSLRATNIASVAAAGQSPLEGIAEMFQSEDSPDRPANLWTKKEAAAYYRVSERTIDRWFSEQVIPTHARVEVGGVVRFRPDVLITSVEAGGAADE